MNNNKHDIETLLQKTSFQELTNEERDYVWLSVARATTSPRLSFISQPMFTSLIIAVALALGAGGTAALADNAVPGDTLFGVDRAVESVRLSLAGEEKKNELRIQFADERVKEIERLAANAALERPAASLVTEATVSEIEADVFTNETVIKIEYSDKKFVFTSEANTREEVIAEIVDTFPSLSETFVSSRLDIEIEDRASRVNDYGSRSVDSLPDTTKIRVQTGISAAVTLLNGVSASVEGDAAVRLKAITDELNTYLQTLPEDTTVDTRINDTGNKTRVELRTEEGRVRVEVRDDGEIRVKTDDDSDDDRDDNRGKSDDDRDDDAMSQSSKSTNNTILEIEADIFTDETVVKVELNDQKTTFVTDADTRAEIITAVLLRYPLLTTAQIDAVLEIETEDRASRDDDSNDDRGDKDDDDDNSGNGKDDDDRDDD